MPILLPKDDPTNCKKCGTKLQTAASKQERLCEACRKDNRWIGPLPPPRPMSWADW